MKEQKLNLCHQKNKQIAKYGIRINFQRKRMDELLSALFRDSIIIFTIWTSNALKNDLFEFEFNRLLYEKCHFDS